MINTVLYFVLNSDWSRGDQGTGTWRRRVAKQTRSTQPMRDSDMGACGYRDPGVPVFVHFFHFPNVDIVCDSDHNYFCPEPVAGS